MMQITKDTTTWRVLVVDDEPDNLKLVADLLEFIGATVAQASSSQQTLDLAASFKPNLILLDLAMPGVDGWETHRRLRARPELDSVPIIALTALAMQADADRVRAEGFDAYITKPFRVKSLIDQLLACVQTFNDGKTIPINKPVAVVQEKAND